MKHRITVLSLLIVLIALTGCASKYKDVLIPPMTEVEAMTDLIDQEVNLTPDQRIKVRQMVVDNAGMRQRIQDKYRAQIIELKEQEKSRLQKFDRQMEGLLTEEQYAAWKPLYREIYTNEMEGYDTPNFRQDAPYDDYRGGRRY